MVLFFDDDVQFCVMLRWQIRTWYHNTSAQTAPGHHQQLCLAETRSRCRQSINRRVFFARRTSKVGALSFKSTSLLLILILRTGVKSQTSRYREHSGAIWRRIVEVEGGGAADKTKTGAGKDGERCTKDVREGKEVVDLLRHHMLG